MHDLARDAEASLRALAVHVQALQNRLELARAAAPDLDAGDVPAELLLHVARVAEALEQAIGHALDRIEPGCGHDAQVLAELMRRQVPRTPAGREAPPTTDRDAATI